MAGFAASMLYVVSVARAEYYFARSFHGQTLEELIDAGFKTEQSYPLDYRFRNRPLRVAIELAMRAKIPADAIVEPLREALRTDPLDLEVIWNLGVLQTQGGNKEAARNTLLFASRLAPGNVLVARAVNEMH